MKTASAPFPHTILNAFDLICPYTKFDHIIEQGFSDSDSSTNTRRPSDHRTIQFYNFRLLFDVCDIPRLASISWYSMLSRRTFHCKHTHCTLHNKKEKIISITYLDIVWWVCVYTGWRKNIQKWKPNQTV